ncbi:MAG: hypothetical protein IPI67_10790 [Myxococcales bacterium]|nr:hypothetical protein [Myxococcales bacterium]
MRSTFVLGVFVLAALLACKSKSSGTITVNGAPFAIDSCKSGQANMPQFGGVDFLDSAGQRVRFLQQPTGQVQVFFFPAGASRTDMLGEGCGTMTMETQNSEVNGVKNIKGTVSANCTGGGNTVVATVAFENCH